MGHIAGSQDADLHHEDGSHRTTPPTARGHVVELHERRVRAHLDAHDVSDPILDCGGADCDICGVEA